MDLREKYAHLDADEYDFEGCYTRMNPDRGYAEEDVVMALVKGKGNYSDGAAMLGRSRSSFANHVARNDNYRALRDDIYQSMMDAIEFGAIETAIMGDSNMQKFFLTTLGKDRGFVSRNETTGKDGAPTHAAVDFSKVDNDTMRKLLEAMDKSDAGKPRLHS